MLIVWFGPASAHISHFCEGFSIALAFYFRRQSTSKRWKFTGTLRLLWHHTLTTFSHGLARGRLDWRHAYLDVMRAHPSTPLRHAAPPSPWLTSCIYYDFFVRTCPRLPWLTSCIYYDVMRAHPSTPLRHPAPPLKRGSKTSYYTTKGVSKLTCVKAYKL